MGTNGRTGDTASGLTPSNQLSRERMSRRGRGLLAKPLDRLLVSERESRDGRFLHYLEGWAVINQANRIFGYDGWAPSWSATSPSGQSTSPIRTARRLWPSECTAP